MENISEHISYNEAIHSEIAPRKGLDNTPNEQQLENMKMWAEKVFEPLREQVSKIRGKDSPLTLSSFLRTVLVNAAVGGSSTSSHCAGEKSGIEEAAGDIQSHFPDFTNKDLFYLVKEKGSFDQLIYEFGDDNQPAWVHVGFRKHDNRMQVLKAISEDGKTKYIPFV